MELLVDDNNEPVLENIPEESATNENTDKTTNNMDDLSLTYGKLLHFFCITLYISPISGFGRYNFWSSASVSKKIDTPYMLNE